jgi:CMP-N,N'-diacetyllegionaminic acid synthase
MKVLGLIPARGGSKGVPRKNVRLLAGKPLVAHSIQQAKDSRYINRVICTTEDPEIADIARDWGAEVPFLRPPELAQDTSTDPDYTFHALEWLRDYEGWLADIVVILWPTCPTRHTIDIDKALELMFENPDAHSVVSVVRPDKSPYKMWRRTTTKFVSPLLTSDVFEQFSTSRQRLPEVLAPNGYIHLVRADIVLRDHSILGFKVMPYDMGTEPIIDIDSESDFQRAEAYLAQRPPGNKG